MNEHKWILDGKSIMIDLNSALDQFSAFGTLHKTINRWECSNCHRVVFLDQSIAQYKYCPHCGVDMGEADVGEEVVPPNRLRSEINTVADQFFSQMQIKADNGEDYSKELKMWDTLKDYLREEEAAADNA